MKNRNDAIGIGDDWSASVPLAYAARGVAFSQILNTGNESCLEATDYLEYLLDDPSTQTVLVYAFPGDGTVSFVISDATATAGNDVTCWGAQWSDANPFVSGDDAPNAFKGFAASFAGGGREPVNARRRRSRHCGLG